MKWSEGLCDGFAAQQMLQPSVRNGGSYLSGSKSFDKDGMAVKCERNFLLSPAAAVVVSG